MKFPSQCFVRRALVAAGVILTAGVALPAHADYPDRPIRFIVPFAAAGSTDLMSRALATQLEKQFSVPVVVDNRPGAGGIIGVSAIVNAEPNGHTVGMAGGIGLFSIFAKEVPFDPRKDLTLISTIYEVPYVLGIATSVPARSFQDLMAYLKANSGKLNHGVAGFSYESLYFRMLNQASGGQSVEIVYKTSCIDLPHLKRRGLRLGFVQPSAQSRN